MTDRKHWKTAQLKPSPDDEGYFAYHEQKMRLMAMPALRRGFEKRLPFLEREHSKEEINAAMKAGQQRHTELRKLVREFEASRAKDEPPATLLTEQQARFAALLRAAVPDQAVSNEVVLGSFGPCQAVLGRVTEAAQSYLWFSTGNANAGSTVAFSIREDEPTTLRVSGSTDADDNFGFDKAEYHWGVAVHQYDIPAPACDSLVVYWVRHASNLFAGTLTAYYGWIRMFPILLVEPDGTAPPNLSRLLSSVSYDYGKYASIDDGDKDMGYGSALVRAVQRSYKVKAGVVSRIYIGLMMDIWAQDGWVTGEGVSTVESPHPSSHFPGDPYGIEYLAWPESMMGNCYLTTAICAVLGKSDSCHELQVLREYRDTYIRARSDGEQLIRRYYSHAPRVLAHVLTRSDGPAFLRSLYERYVEPCVALIERGQNAPALELYRQMLDFVETASVNRPEA